MGSMERIACGEKVEGARSVYGTAGSPSPKAKNWLDDIGQYLQWKKYQILEGSPMRQQKVRQEPLFGI